MCIRDSLKLAPGAYQITVFGSEPHPNYNRILLSPVLAGEQTVEEIILNPRQWYEDNGIALHSGCTVTRIDRARRVVEASDGLKLRGMDVTVVHLMPWLMERQLDRTAAQMLQKSLETKGLAFRL